MRIKVFVSLLAAVLLGGWGIPLHAHDFKVGDLYYNQTSATTVEVTYKGKKAPDGEKPSYPRLKAAEVPESISVKGKNYQVTAIGESAFDGCKDLLFIRLPSSITAIKSKAFRKCSSLQEIKLPESTIQLSFGAFSYSGLEFFRANVSAENLGDYLFSGCKSLKKIVLIIEKTDKTTPFISIPDGLCMDCISLEQFVSNATITDYGSFAFYGCKNLEFPSSLYAKTIGKYAFKDCTRFKQIKLNNVREIGEGAFKDCTGLKDLTFSNYALTSIGPRAFKGCHSLGAELWLPKTVKKIASEAFSDCPSLKAIHMSYKTVVEGTEMNGLPVATLLKNPAISQSGVLFYEDSDISFLTPDRSSRSREIARLYYHYATISNKTAEKEVIVCFYANGAICVYVGTLIDYGLVLKTYDYVPDSNRIHFYNTAGKQQARITPEDFTLKYGTDFSEKFMEYNETVLERNKQAISTLVNSFKLKKTKDPEKKASTSDDDWYYDYWY